MNTSDRSDQIPQAPDAELAIIGALLLNKSVPETVRQRLQPEHFFTPSGRKMYEAVLDLDTLDPVQLTEKLRSRGDLDLVGGWSFVATLTDRAIRADLEPCIDRVIETARKRKLWVVTTQARDATNNGKTPEQIVDFLRETIEQFQESQEPWEEPKFFNQYSLPEFPIDALPAWWRSFVEGLARETQTPTDLAAMLSLSACAGAIAGNVEIEARRGWREPLNLFTVVALPPGNRKSAVFSSVAQPLESVEASLIADMRAKVAAAESEYRTLAARVDHLEKAAAKIEDEEERRAKQREAARAAQELATMTVPKLPRLLADDATPETLATLLQDQAGRIALFSPEGDLFDIMGGRYSNGSPNLGVFLKGHPGDDLRVDRRGRSEYIKRPALTIGLAVQPDVLRGLVAKPQFKGRGLLGRFLYSLPKSTLGGRRARVAPLDEEARTEYARYVRAMAGLSVSFDEDGARIPLMLSLTADADDYLAGFQDEIEPLLAETGELGALSDWAGKLAGAVLRIAGVLHLAEHAGRFQPWPEKVSAAILKKAIEIGRYLIPHAQAAYAEMGADPEIEAAQYLMKWLLKWIGSGNDLIFRKQDAWQGTKGRFKKVADLDQALALLIEHEFIRQRVSEGRKGPGRKPGGVYEINPGVTSYYSYNPYNSTEKGNSRDCRKSRNEDETRNFETSFSPDTEQDFQTDFDRETYGLE